jgi:hypothetical protein
MSDRHLNNWRWWLQTGSVGLLGVTAFAPLPKTPQEILTLVAIGGTLVYLITDSSASRRWISRFLLPLAALMLLAVVLSVDPTWVLFGFLGISAGSFAWGVVRREHAEYLAEREHLR